MAVYIVVVAALCMAASAAPPAAPRLYTHPSAQIQQINPLDYYLDNQDVAYYSQGQQKQADASNDPGNAGAGAPSRLETLEPDSEVELIPGAQNPQQPPQQTPVAPNVPGILPGQRVFIVHMPVPGYRPGTIGGYQPVYIVAAAPEGNVYAPNGYQNPAGQAVYSPFLGYPRPGLGLPQGNPGFVVGGAPLTLNRPYDFVYQEPVVAYQPVAPEQGAQGSGESVRLTQMVSLQGHPAPLRNEPRPANAPTDPELKKANLESSAAKEAEEPRRNARPVPPHGRSKA